MPLDTVHLQEDFFPLNLHADADFLSDLFQLPGYFAKGLGYVLHVKLSVVTWVFRMSFVVSVFLKSLLLFYKVVLNLAGLVERKNIHKFVPCHEESKCKRSEYGTRNG